MKHRAGTHQIVDYNVNDTSIHQWNFHLRVLLLFQNEHRITENDDVTRSFDDFAGALNLQIC